MNKCNVSLKVAKRWVAEADLRCPKYEDGHRAGRPIKFGSPIKKEIRAKSKSPRLNASQITRKFNKKHATDSLTISNTTVRRMLSSMRAPPKWKKLTNSRRLRVDNQEARRKFAKCHKPMAAIPWVYMDGKILSLTRDKCGLLTYAWQHPDKPLVKSDKRLVAYCHFYGAVGEGFKSQLTFVPPTGYGKTPKSAETFKAVHYLQVLGGLKKELQARYPAGQQYRLIRDRASQHLKKTNAGPLDTLNMSILEAFPAQSWDINCIEHVWAQLQRRMSIRRPCTVQGLKRAICQEWMAIPQSTIDKLVAGVPKRLQRIAGNDGRWISPYQG
jgi:hypothetical protein